MDYNYPVPEQLSRYPTMGGGAGYDPDRFTEPNWPTGDRIRRTDADHVVETAAELAAAIRGAAPGEVVWVPGGVEMDVSGLRNLDPAANVVVASDRGLDGGEGALLYAERSIHALFKLRGDGVRVTGLRFRFPVTEKVAYSSTREGTGIAADGENGELDNCVFRGFGHAGVETGRDGFVGKTHIHHCAFVDNPMDSLGYGVVVYRGDPLIQACYFDHNRHGIAAGGEPDCAYTAYNNFFGAHTTSHIIDMHEGNDGQGGRRVDIVQNVVLGTHRLNGHYESAIYIRGEPLERSLIAHNQFAHDSEPEGIGAWGEAYHVLVRDLDDSTVLVCDNHYGQTDPAPIPEH